MILPNLNSLFFSVYNMGKDKHVSQVSRNSGLSWEETAAEQSMEKVSSNWFFSNHLQMVDFYRTVNKNSQSNYIRTN